MELAAIFARATVVQELENGAILTHLSLEIHHVAGIAGEASNLSTLHLASLTGARAAKALGGVQLGIAIDIVTSDAL